MGSGPESRDVDPNCTIVTCTNHCTRWTLGLLHIISSGTGFRVGINHYTSPPLLVRDPDHFSSLVTARILSQFGSPTDVM
ncbi:hypothetical protein BHE74_00046599 [Ensete ventricosum]|uniref:Uncharacterized protein n=1 Tax=Ensete ventricosum TaxID=4639 RepID=A0A444D3M2_ENSVE|nr:hypothetical protein GW17_00044905 [Ensete ventricosum]RWW47420.1 hypothetical protein BHE74_00046599 [Ensete ventricosum]RZR74517.1 hypothetical protein BHM03_00037867 [Ensete ventricosum]